MALKCSDFRVKCVTWNIELPHPYHSVRSPTFLLDGIERHLQVNGTIKSVPTGSFDDVVQYDKVEAWNIKLQSRTHEESAHKYRVVPYVEQKHPVYIRIADDIGSPALERYMLGNREDSLNMLFLFLPGSPRASEEISISQVIEDASTQTVNFESLFEDMVHLLHSQEYSDVTLKCGDSSFPVHKNILATRSDVFATMFRQDMRESKSGVVDIVDLDSSVVEQFVHYLYSDRVEEMTMDKAIELYQVAEKYAIPSLKLLCASFMRENVSKEVICEVLLLADQMADSVLLEDVACFAVEAGDFLKTEEWRDFAIKHPNIGTNVLLKYLKKS